MNELRGYIRDQIAAREPVDDREAESCRRFREFFEALDDPFSETADPVHVTASGLVVGARGVVLHKHRRLGIWLQPGGHIEPGESPWEAAVRESREETGLDVVLLDPDDPPTIVHVDVHPGPRGHTHLDVRYLLGGVDADPSPPAGESQEVFWFEWDEAIARADPGLRGALGFIRHQHAASF